MVLRFKLAKAAKLVVAETSILLLPVVERRVTDTQLAADLSDLRPGLGLAQREDDLRLGELRCLHSDHVFL